MILYLIEYDAYHANQSIPSWRAIGKWFAGRNGKRGGNRRNGHRITIPYKRNARVGKAIERSGEDI